MVIKKAAFITSLVGVLLISSCCYLYLTRPKIAYIRSLEVVYSFNGMKQAHAEYKSQADEWQSNLDTLKRQYSDALLNYKNNSQKLSDKDKKEQEDNIKRLENNLKNYSAAINREAQEKDKKLTEAVLNQINSFVEAYAKKKGYDLVLAAQGNGSVLYGAKAMDITNEVIEGMNKEYQALPVDDANKVKEK